MFVKRITSVFYLATVLKHERSPIKLKLLHFCSVIIQIAHLRLLSLQIIRASHRYIYIYIHVAVCHR